MTKLFEGGYVPLILALLVYALMYCWHAGIVAIANRLGENALPLEEFLANIRRDAVTRVPGTAIFLTRAKSGTPPVIQWYVKHSNALHDRVVAVTLDTASTPWIAADRRLSMSEAAPNFWTVCATYGFMERPDMPKLMSQIATRGCPLDPSKLSYFIGTENIVPRDDGHGISRLIVTVFGAMLRNCARVTDYLRIPADQIVDVGRQIAI
jgi:KUP system potassium uptake protein